MFLVNNSLGGHCFFLASLLTIVSLDMIKLLIGNINIASTIIQGNNNSIYALHSTHVHVEELCRTHMNVIELPEKPADQTADFTTLTLLMCGKLNFMLLQVHEILCIAIA